MSVVESPRRRLGLIVALAALALVLSAPPALARIAYVTDFEGDTVSRIDTATNEVVGAPIPASPGALTIAVSPDGRTAYAPGANSITAIDTQSNLPTATIALSGQAVTIAIAPDGSTAYITTLNSNLVQVVDLRANRVSGAPIAVGESAYGVAFATDGRTAYVGDPVQGVVHVIDTQTRQIAGAPIPVGPTPLELAVMPDGGTVLVIDEDESAVYAIGTQTRQVARIPIPVGNLFSVAIAPDGTKAYLVNNSPGGIYPLDIQTRQVGPVILAGEPLVEPAITPDGRTLYVTLEAESRVVAIDTATNQEVRSIAVAGRPSAIAIVPNQSPVASFTARTSQATTRVKFNGSASDPDGTVSIFNWGFGDGTFAANAGPSPSHAYKRGGKFTATLNVVDNEGCSGAQVFTGRTAYCSGASIAAQTVNVAPNQFKFGKLVRNRRKGTAKLRVNVPVDGTLVLSGKKIKRAKRRAGKAGVVILPIKPKQGLKNVLGAKGSAKAKVRVTFRPTGGAARSKAKSIQLFLG